MFCKDSPSYFLWKWIVLRFTNQEQKNYANTKQKPTQYDVFAENNPERYCGINDILFTNDSSKELLHQSVLVPNLPNVLR